MLLTAAPIAAMAAIACFKHAKLRFDPNDYHLVTLGSPSLKTSSPAGNLVPAPVSQLPRVAGAGTSFDHIHGERNGE